MDIQTKDGILLRGIPDGTPDEEIKARIQTIRAERDSGEQAGPVKPYVPSGERGLDVAGLIAGNPATRFVAGMVSPFMGTAQNLEQTVEQAPFTLGPAAAPMMAARALMRRARIPTADDAVRGFEEAKTRGMQEYGDGGYDIAGLAGTVVSPAFLKAGQLVPAAQSYFGRVGQGAAIGAVAGATAPVTSGEDFGHEKALQTGLGATIGGAIPAVATPLKAVGKVAYHGLIEPWANPAAIKGRAYLEAAGNRGRYILELLRQNRQIVPGSAPTAGEAAAPAGSAEFAALQRSAAKVKPSEYLARSDQQNAARLEAVRQVGQDEHALFVAEQRRAADAAENYGRALRSEALQEPSQRDSALSIAQFVAKEGGLKKSVVRGDINADYSDLPPTLQGKGLGLRKIQHDGPTAKNPDEMLERLQEEGYLGPNANHREMYTMIEAELSTGVKSFFSLNDLDAVAAARHATRVPPNRDLIELSNRPSFRKAVSRAMQIAAEEGVNIGDPIRSMKGLHYVKMALDDTIEKASAKDSGIGRSELRAITGTKEKLLQMMDEISPDYKFARETYQQQSRPINQMQVGQYLENKLVPSIGEGAKQTANTFATAMRDAPGTIRRATGQPRFDSLSEVLTPEQLRIVNLVRVDLARNARFEDMSRKGAQAAPNALDLATQSMEATAGGKIPNLLHRGAMIANAIIYRAEGKINKKLAAEIATEMLNPPAVAESLAAAMKRQKNNRALAHFIYNAQTPLTAGAINTGARGVSTEDK